MKLPATAFGWRKVQQDGIERDHCGESRRRTRRRPEDSPTHRAKLGGVYPRQRSRARLSIDQSLPRDDHAQSIAGRHLVGPPKYVWEGQKSGVNVATVFGFVLLDFPRPREELARRPGLLALLSFGTDADGDRRSPRWPLDS